MFSLQEILGHEQGNQAVDQISNQLGAEPSAVNSAISMALPMIVGAMANNATQPQLQNEIRQNDGSILDNLGGFLGNSNQIQTAGGGILGMLLGGGQQTAAAQQISRQSGLGMGQVASLMLMLAPLVMGYYGRQQSNGNLDAGGIGAMLGQQQQQIQQQQPGTAGMLSSILDRNHDGSSMDDLMSLAGQFLGRR
jgi:hypothetical protein